MFWNFFTVFVALVLTGVSSFFLYEAINDNASTLLADLKTATALAQFELEALTARVPQIQECVGKLTNNTLLFQNCSVTASAIVEADVLLLDNKTQTLAQNTVANFNTTVIKIITEACERLVVLQQTVNATEAVPFNVQNGTVTVQLVGGDEFSVPYSIKQLKLNDLRLVYLALEPWPYALTTTNGTNNPMFKFTQFTPTIMQPGGPTLIKPLTVEQSARFLWSDTNIKTSSYLWDGATQELVIQSIGNSSQYDTVALYEPLSVTMQYI